MIRSAAVLARMQGDSELLPEHVTAVAGRDPAASLVADEPAVPPRRMPRMGTAFAAVVDGAVKRARAAGRAAAAVDDLVAAAAPTAEGGDTASGDDARIAVGTDEAVVDRTLRVLARAGPALVVVVGDADAAPERCMVAVAQRLAADAAPYALRGALVNEMDHRGAGMSTVLQGLRQAVVQEPGDAPAVILVTDAVAVSDAPSGPDVLAAALHVSAGVITTADDLGLQRLREHQLLRRHIRVIRIEAPTAEESVALLQRAAGAVATRHGVEVSESAIEAAVALSVRYQPERSLPGKARDLLEDAAAWSSMRERAAVTDDDVAAVIAQDHGIDPSTMLSGGAGALNDLERRLHARVIGQHAAVRAVADAIRRAETGVRDPDRPLGSFLFLGPTGVGKTELARSLAATLFGAESALIRLDMGEYQEAHSVARLVGAPPGYVGHEQGGHLSEPLRRRPYSVVLLDEIEKAHPDVWNTLLAVLDEGRLTDGSGRTVDVTNAVLVMTSNLAGRAILDRSLSADVVTAKVEAALVEHFPPEFHSRIDDVVVFRRLGAEDLEAIVKLQVSRLARRLRARDLHVHVEPDACRWLAAQALGDPHGARPLRSLIRHHLEDVLARAVLDGRLRRGHGVDIGLAGDTLSVVQEPPW